MQAAAAPADAPQQYDGALRNLQRRLTGDRREFSEVMAMARRTSSQSGGSVLAHSRRPTNMQVRCVIMWGVKAGVGVGVVITSTWQSKACGLYRETAIFQSQIQSAFQPPPPSKAGECYGRDDC